MVLLNVSSSITTLRGVTTAPVISGTYKMASTTVHVRERWSREVRGGKGRDGREKREEEMEKREGEKQGERR